MPPSRSRRRPSDVLRHLSRVGWASYDVSAESSERPTASQQSPSYDVSAESAGRPTAAQQSPLGVPRRLSRVRWASYRVSAESAGRPIASYRDRWASYSVSAETAGRSASRVEPQPAPLDTTIAPEDRALSGALGDGTLAHSVCHGARSCSFPFTSAVAPGETSGDEGVHVGSVGDFVVFLPKKAKTPREQQLGPEVHLGRKAPKSGEKK